MTATSTPRPSPERIFMTLNAFQQTAALRSAIELDIFSTIDEGKNTPADIAADVQASERGVRTLCDYMTVLGFLRKVGGRYLLTPESTAFLSKRSPAYMGAIAGFLGTAHHLNNHALLTEAVRRGGSAGGHGNNHRPEDEIWVAFARSMAPMTVPPANFIAELIGAKEGKACRVLDIAAGHGMYGITIAKHNPNAEVTAADWPAVLEVAKENADKAGVGERYKTVPGSAFTSQFGEGYDVVLLTNILHHFDVATCVKLLKRVHAALEPGGKLVILEFVPNEDRVSPPVAASFSLTMLASTDAGDAYTFSEYQNMLASAGFGKTEIHPMPESPQQVIVSVK